MWRTWMDTQLLLLALQAFLVLMIAGPLLLLFIRGMSRRARGRHLTAQTNAIISNIAVRASTFGCGWVVTAHVPSLSGGQSLTFQSPRLPFRPTQHIGDQILIHYDPKHPHH